MRFIGSHCSQCGKRDWDGFRITMHVDDDDDDDNEAQLCSTECALAFLGGVEAYEEAQQAEASGGGATWMPRTAASPVRHAMNTTESEAPIDRD